MVQGDAPGGASSRPYAMAADSAGRIWLVETGPQPNRFVGFDPSTGSFFEPAARIIIDLEQLSADSLLNRTGERYVLFCGVDDLFVESFVLGAVGWVAGLVNAFPRETVALYDLMRAGRRDEALTLYRWFMPLLHLDTRPTLVQCIKYAQAAVGRGSERVRAPRLKLDGAERAEVEAIVARALAERPDVSRLRAAA